jgi:hypothetical protein
MGKPSRERLGRIIKDRIIKDRITKNRVIQNRAGKDRLAMGVSQSFCLQYSGSEDRS